MIPIAILSCFPFSFVFRLFPLLCFFSPKKSLFEMVVSPLKARAGDGFYKCRCPLGIMYSTKYVPKIYPFKSAHWS